MVPRLRLLRHLVGHSGRVEALAAAPAGGGGGGVGGGMRLLASSGRDSTLKVGDEGRGAGEGLVSTIPVRTEDRSGRGELAVWTCPS